ncbi:unnamed protein product [Protopolystoma xenopodis]|uniref:Uncharacterized protein n=1 Tax=Protopolystoma xenopodis TaxID=117903 RepID=A0A3S5A0H8_9PLAT|nr:unnamed protein product [Protopolystoma xenopodis]
MKGLVAAGGGRLLGPGVGKLAEKLHPQQTRQLSLGLTFSPPQVCYRYLLSAISYLLFSSNCWPAFLLYSSSLPPSTPPCLPPVRIFPILHTFLPSALRPSTPLHTSIHISTCARLIPACMPASLGHSAHRLFMQMCNVYDRLLLCSSAQTTIYPLSMWLSRLPNLAEFAQVEGISLRLNTHLHRPTPPRQHRIGLPANICHCLAFSSHISRGIATSASALLLRSPFSRTARPTRSYWAQC